MTTKDYNIIVDTCADKIYRFLLANLKDEDLSQDIVQDSFERLWINREKIELDKAASFLFKIAYNIMIDNIRHNKFVTSETEILDFGEDSYESSAQLELKDVINSALAKLSDIYRSLILLRDYEGYSYDEIAQITELSEAQVKVYIFRARKQMKDYIGNFKETLL